MTDLSNLREGDRIVLSSGQAWTSPFERPWLRDGARSGLRVVRFVGLQDGNVVHLDDDGNEDSVPSGDVIWSSPLPDFGDDGNVSLVGACLNARDRPILLHMRSTSRNSALAIDIDEPVGLPRFGASAETMVVTFDDHLPEQEELIVAMGHTITFEDGLAVHHFAHAETVARGLSATAAHGIFSRLKRTGAKRLGIATIGELLRRRELAWASTFPDQALVLIRKRPGLTIPVMDFLAKSGRTIFESDDPESDFGGSCSRGLWMFESVRWWQSESHEGEKDGGMEADWRPATRADAAAFGLTAEDVGAMITRIAGDETDSMSDIDIFDHHCAVAHRTVADADREGEAA